MKKGTEVTQEIHRDLLKVPPEDLMRKAQAITANQAPHQELTDPVIVVPVLVVLPGLPFQVHLPDQQGALVPQADQEDNLKKSYYETNYTIGNIIAMQFNIFCTIT